MRQPLKLVPNRIDGALPRNLGNLRFLADAAARQYSDDLRQRLFKANEANQIRPTPLRIGTALQNRNAGLDTGIREPSLRGAFQNCHDSKI